MHTILDGVADIVIGDRQTATIEHFSPFNKLFGSSMLVASFVCLALLVIADLPRSNRVMVEESLERQKQMQYNDVPLPRQETAATKPEAWEAPLERAPTP